MWTSCLGSPQWNEPTLPTAVAYSAGSCSPSWSTAPLIWSEAWQYSSGLASSLARRADGTSAPSEVPGLRPLVPCRVSRPPGSSACGREAAWLSTAIAAASSYEMDPPMMMSRDDYEISRIVTKSPLGSHGNSTIDDSPHWWTAKPSQR